MSLWSRIVNVVRGNRLNREIHEELESHIAEAVEQGRNPADARKAFGSALRYREESRDARLVTWLESLRADVVFGWRQLHKNKVTSAAAILSLALAIGACMSAFRLIDALLLRPLPVAEPERLFAIFYEGVDSLGKTFKGDTASHPMFRQMRAVVKDEAELIGVTYARPWELTYTSDREWEKAYLQHVSGWMFSDFGLRPALGRLFTEDDDRKPGAHPYAVLSHHYWTHRFNKDPKVIGRTFRIGNELYEIVGVAEERFTGTEPGIITDIFLPMMMEARVESLGWSGHRILARLRPGVAVEPVRERLTVAYRAFQQVRAKALFSHWPKQRLDQYFQQKLLLEPAAGGVSRMQGEYRRPLTALGWLVALVLLIACANVANLMSAQAAARARDMALRVSIGAGRWRLVRLVLIESVLLAFLAAALGGWFAWWSAPWVVGMISPADSPVRLLLPADWRVLGFGLALALSVTMLFGLAPALRASSVRPVRTLKGGESPHSRPRLMHALIAVQVAFCFVVLFVAGLFVATFERLTRVSTGFSAEGVVALSTVAKPSQPPAFWDAVADQLRSTPGVEAVALAEWPLLSGSDTSGFIEIHGASVGKPLVSFMKVSPGWTSAMKIPLLGGRDFRASDTSPGVAIVNETFAKQYFNGENPIGRLFERVEADNKRVGFRIVGLVGDVRDVRGLRGPIRPTAYYPLRSIDADGALQPKGWGTFIVRTSTSDPLALAPVLRQQVSRIRSEFRISRIRSQQAINNRHTIRERLLAMLALFFAAVALLLAAVGLYGVLHYSVLQRRREIGIRMALGARAGDVARRVSSDISSMVLVGALAGLALGMVSVRYVETLLYDVKATDFTMLALPTLTLLAAALLAALPAVMHAVRIDPARTLRSE